MTVPENKYPALEDQGSRIILRGDLGEHAILDLLGGDEEGFDEFRDLFELDPTEYLGDPTDSFYQVITFTRIITRKSDGAKFGYTYWDSPGNDSIEMNWDQDPSEVGIEIEYDEDWNQLGGTPYVFLPVEPFQRQGYAVKGD